MKYVVTLLVIIVLAAGCAEETCPAMMKQDYALKKRTKIHYGKKKPTPSLIHITRVNYKPGKN